VDLGATSLGIPSAAPRDGREWADVDASGAWAPEGRRGQMTMPTPAEWSFGATIPARDLDGTRRFYEDVLGAQVVTEDPGGIIYRSGDSYFSLYPTEFAGTAQHTVGAFMVRDVEAAVADLRGKGVTFEEYDLPGLKTVNGIAELGGMRGAWFKDPEGNILSVVEPPAA
jgi:catechol 2,3-dioxygenase-like lactoylglutathione lyase family enzyme